MDRTAPAIAQARTDTGWGNMSAHLEDELVELRRQIATQRQLLQTCAAERDEAIAQVQAARDRQVASAEILRAIADAPGDAARALQLIAQTSAHLFGAPSVSIQLADESGAFTQEYLVGAIAQRIGSAYPRSNIRVGGRNMPGTVVAENRQIHIPDLDHLDPSMSDWPGLPHARAGGTRTLCGTPLRREGKAIGALIVFRDRLLPFADEELALLQTFADQAVIAIENARLFNETQEALERQTATSEILRAIAASPSNSQPVFESIVVSAARRLQCDLAFVFLSDERNYWPVAGANPEGLLSDLGPRSVPIDWAANFPSRALLSKETFYLPDWSAVELPPHERAIHELLGLSSCLYMPLLRDGEARGLLGLGRNRPSSFNASDIAQAESFRDQAVIAIQNARLFNETKEALERQTATANVLKVISRSVSEAAPVFEAILNSCQRLFGLEHIAIYLVESDMVKGVAQRGWDGTGMGADARPLAGSSTGQAIAERRAVHFADLADKPDLPEEYRVRIRGFGGLTMLYAPMLTEERGVGSIVVSRKPAKPFTEKEIALVQSFADQAAIAIQNTRLFNETQEALERQTATAEILKVISASPTSATPVFDAIVLTAARLFACQIAGVWRLSGDLWLPVTGATPERLFFEHEHAPPMPLDPTANFPSQAALARKTLLVTDYTGPDTPPHERYLGEHFGIASSLFLPLTRGEECTGMFLLTSARKDTFDAKAIALAESFRDQALIAIENARLFNETQEALQQQTATADVLKVISRSVFDLQAVFDTLLTTAVDSSAASAAPSLCAKPTNCASAPAPVRTVI